MILRQEVASEAAAETSEAPEKTPTDHLRRVLAEFSKCVFWNRIGEKSMLPDSVSISTVITMPIVDAVSLKLFFWI